MFSNTSSFPIFTPEGKGWFAGVAVVSIVATIGLGVFIGSLYQKNQYEEFLDATEIAMATLIATSNQDAELSENLREAMAENITLTVQVDALTYAETLFEERHTLMQRKVVMQDDLVKALQYQNEVMTIKLETYAMENE